MIMKQPLPNDLLAEVRRIFEEEGFENAERLEQWDGDELDELREILSEDEMEILLDQLGDRMEDFAMEQYEELEDSR
jgi:hypothetical protein